MQFDDADRLLSRDEVEARFGLPRNWLEQVAHQGKGPPMVKISRRMVRYRVGDLKSWLEARRVDGEATAA